jgi:hypothetical protein
VLTITDDSTRADLAEAINHLRAKQRRCVIPSTAAEIADDIDDLLDAWLTAS